MALAVNLAEQANRTILSARLAATGTALIGLGAGSRVFLEKLG